jgi:CBS domain-containing protein
MSVTWEPRTVGELMTSDPIVVTMDLPLAEAAQLMDFYRVSGLPVIDWSGAIVGLVSQTDLLHARTTEALWAAWPGLCVKHVMTSPAVVVTAGTTVDDAAALMESRRIHRLVVVDADGDRPIGVLSLTDLVHAMAERGDA